MAYRIENGKQLFINLDRQEIFFKQVLDNLDNRVKNTKELTLLDKIKQGIPITMNDVNEDKSGLTEINGIFKVKLREEI